MQSHRSLMGTAALFDLKPPPAQTQPTPLDELEWQLWLAIAELNHPVWPEKRLLKRDRLERGDLKGYWVWLNRAHAEINFHPHPNEDAQIAANRRYAEVQRKIYGAYLPTYYRMRAEMQTGAVVDPLSFRPQADVLINGASATPAEMPSS